MTGNELKKQLWSLTRGAIKLNEKQYDELSATLTSRHISLEGYLLWLSETKGVTGLSAKLVNEQNIQQYEKAQEMERRALPQHIVNVGELYNKLTNSKIDFDNSLQQLENMCFPYAMYFMFASVGFPIEKYRKAARDYTKKFPNAVLSLPEPFCSLGKALIT